MISDWPNERINPVIEGDNRYYNDFEKFAVTASSSTMPMVEKLEDEASILSFCSAIREHNDFESRLEPAIMNMVVYASCSGANERLRVLNLKFYVDFIPIAHGSVNNVFRQSQRRCTRHKDHLTRDIKPGYRAFSKPVYDQICEKFNLPSTYQQIRTYANGSGAIARFTDRDGHNSVKRISFAIRAPYSPLQVKSIWSLACSWDVCTSETTALFDGVSDLDLKMMVDYLSVRQKHLGHPLVLPMMMLETLCQCSVSHRNFHQKSLYEIEARMGVTRGPDLDTDTDFQINYPLEATTIKCHRILTALIYLERRLSFIKSLAEDMEGELNRVTSFATGAPTPKVEFSNLHLEEIVSNCLSFTNNQISLCLCLQKRAQGFLNMIYLLITQRDTRATIELTSAAKFDSSAMMAIAALTMVFLPATFIASFFGMNFFQYNSEKSNITTSGNLWIFFAATIPLTVVVFALWLVWIKWQAISWVPSKAKSRNRSSTLASTIYFKLPSDLNDELASGPLYARLPH